MKPTNGTRMARATNLTDPKGDTITLSLGGELSIVPVEEGLYRLTVDVEGGHFSYPLTSADVWNLRKMLSASVRSLVPGAAA